MNIVRWILTAIVPAVLFPALSGCADVVGGEGASAPSLPDGFPEIVEPADNPTTPEKVRLGRHLFYDNRLSLDYSVSCGSCHRQQYAFTDGRTVSTGFDGLAGTRNAMSLTNVAYNLSFLWDGGVPTLEQQVLAPIMHPAEMNMPFDTLVARLEAVPDYEGLFRAAWGTPEVTLERITKSVAAFERTLISGNAPYDRWKRGDADAMSEAAVRGEALFFGERGDCFHCHGSFNFTDNDFHNNGLAPDDGDQGRGRITQREFDNGLFRAPTLRNIEVTGPYMHDGSFADLKEVLRNYNSGGKAHPNRDPLMRPLGLTDAELDDLEAFLRALTDQTFLTDTAFSDPWQ